MYLKRPIVSPLILKLSEAIFDKDSGELLLTFSESVNSSTFIVEDLVIVIIYSQLYYSIQYITLVHIICIYIYIYI